MIVRPKSVGEEQMAWMLRLWAAAVLAAIIIGRAEASDRMIDLLRNGYQVHTEGYLSFDFCEWDKVHKVGPYIFVCRTYDYVYHYGKAEILAKLFVSGERQSLMTYLCLGEEKCLQGELRRL
jgi:hypothetical protein